MDAPIIHRELLKIQISPFRSYTMHTIDYLYFPFSIGAIAAAGSYFGQGTGPILLDGLECVGDEEELGLCPHLGYGTHDCSHMEDAAVICQRMFFNFI